MDIYVRSGSELDNLISQLKRYNDQFAAKLSEMDSTQRSLDSAWDGEANTEFNNLYKRESAIFKQFKQVVDEYITRLKAIKDEYVRTETQNQKIAGTRGYSG